MLLPAETHLNVDVNVFVKITKNDLDGLGFFKLSCKIQLKRKNLKINI